MNATTLSIPTDDGDLPGLLWLPAASERPGPGLVVLQEIFGLSASLQRRCAQLAELGYAVLAPQLFARLDPPVVGLEDPADDQAAAEAWLGEGMALTQRLPWDRAEADALAALDALRAHEAVASERVGLLGFCYGGGLAFAAAATAAATAADSTAATTAAAPSAGSTAQRSAATDSAASCAGPPPAVLVSYYGSALPSLLPRAEHVTLPSLHHVGTADSFLPPPTVEAITEAVTDAGTRPQVHVALHEGAGHAFDNPHPFLHHVEASTTAWQQTVDFLAATLTWPEDP